MSLNEAYLILVPGAHPEQDRSVIKKENYKCVTVLVKSEKEAIEVAKEVQKEHDIHAFICCAGFSNEGVGNLSAELGKDVGVSVVRGDNRSSKIVSDIIKAKFKES